MLHRTTFFTITICTTWQSNYHSNVQNSMLFRQYKLYAAFQSCIVQEWQTFKLIWSNCALFQIPAAHPRKLLWNKSKEPAVMGFANTNGCKLFKRWDLCGSKIEDRNAGQNVCKSSWHVPSSNLQNKLIAAAWQHFWRGIKYDEYRCSAKCCIRSNLDS